MKKIILDNYDFLNRCLDKLSNEKIDGMESFSVLQQHEYTNLFFILYQLQGEYFLQDVFIQEKIEYKDHSDLYEQDHSTLKKGIAKIIGIDYDVEKMKIFRNEKLKIPVLVQIVCGTIRYLINKEN